MKKKPAKKVSKKPVKKVARESKTKKQLYCHDCERNVGVPQSTYEGIDPIRLRHNQFHGKAANRYTIRFYGK